MHKKLLAAAVLAAALGVPAGTASAANVRPQVLGVVQSSGTSATLTVKYACDKGDGVWVSVKQAAGGVKDARITQEGGSRFARTWQHSHRNPITCNGRTQTQTFAVDGLEYGQGGVLQRGHAWVQFCVTDAGSEQLTLSQQGWITVQPR